MMGAIGSDSMTWGSDSPAATRARICIPCPVNICSTNHARPRDRATTPSSRLAAASDDWSSSSSAIAAASR